MTASALALTMAAFLVLTGAFAVTVANLCDSVADTVATTAVMVLASGAAAILIVAWWSV